jgi:predicted PurR-regulated permease PerM
VPGPEASPSARAGRASDEQPSRCRLARLFQAADRHRVPLRTILVTVVMVVAAYLAGKLLYMLRDIVLPVLVAGFVAVLLNPAVDKVQRRIPRWGPSVLIITLCAALVFIRLAVAFGVPLANGITHLVDRLPGYITSAEHGQGWRAPRDQVSRPELGAAEHSQAGRLRTVPQQARPYRRQGRVSIIVELFTVFVLVVLLLEGPKMWSWTLDQLARAPGPRSPG